METADDSFAVTTKASDTEWYFSAKSLIFKWARIIGPSAFLVHHFIKSQCPERGLKGQPIVWSEAESILGISSKEVQMGLVTLKSVGLLQEEEDCLIVLDPDDAFLNFQNRQRKLRGTNNEGE